MFGISFQRSCTAYSSLIECLFLDCSSKYECLLWREFRIIRPEIQHTVWKETCFSHSMLSCYSWHRGYLSLLRVRGCDLPLNKRIENFRSGADSGADGLWGTWSWNWNLKWFFSNLIFLDLFWPFVSKKWSLVLPRNPTILCSGWCHPRLTWCFGLVVAVHYMFLIEILDGWFLQQYINHHFEPCM